MRAWIFENGIKVYKRNHDYGLYCFSVYSDDKYLGSVYPSTMGDMEFLIKDLDNGYDSVSAHWEDGCGNACTIDGWDANEYNVA